MNFSKDSKPKIKGEPYAYIDKDGDLVVKSLTLPYQIAIIEGDTHEVGSYDPKHSWNPEKYAVEEFHKGDRLIIEF